MSYILDALRKADHERKLGHAPQAEQLAGSTDSGAARSGWGRAWPWLLAANAALLLALMMFLLRDEPAAEIPKSEAPAAATTGVPASQAGQSRPRREPDSPLGDPVADVSEFGEFEFPESAQTDDSLDAGRENTAVAEEPGPAPDPAAPSIESVMAPDAPAATPQTKSAAPPAESEPEPPRIRDLRELPAEFRRNLPELRLNTHFYSDNAGRRFVIINLQKYREGDVLQAGPEVAEIRTDGVVLDYRGERFLLPR